MQMTFDFTAHREILNSAESNDYHRLPSSEKQQRFAREIAARSRTKVPPEILADRTELSKWIDAHKGSAQPKRSQFSSYPSSKQVAFAERIARLKRRAVPQECFKDRNLMSHWIDSNR